MTGLRSIRMSLGVTPCDAKILREACRLSSLLNRLHARLAVLCFEYARRFRRVRLSVTELQGPGPRCEEPQWRSSPGILAACLLELRSLAMSMDHEVPPVLRMWLGLGLGLGFGLGLGLGLGLG